MTSQILGLNARAISVLEMGKTEEGVSLLLDALDQMDIAIVGSIGSNLEETSSTDDTDLELAQSASNNAAWEDFGEGKICSKYSWGNNKVGDRKACYSKTDTLNASKSEESCSRYQAAVSRASLMTHMRLRETRSEEDSYLGTSTTQPCIDSCLSDGDIQPPDVSSGVTSTADGSFLASEDTAQLKLCHDEDKTALNLTQSFASSDESQQEETEGRQEKPINRTGLQQPYISSCVSDDSDFLLAQNELASEFASTTGTESVLALEDEASLHSPPSEDSAAPPSLSHSLPLLGEIQQENVEEGKLPSNTQQTILVPVVPTTPTRLQSVSLPDFREQEAADGDRTQERSMLVSDNIFTFFQRVFLLIATDHDSVSETGMTEEPLSPKQSAVVLYNLAVVHHNNAVHRINQPVVSHDDFRTALEYYDMVFSIIQEFWTGDTDDDTEDDDDSNSRDGEDYMLLLLAVMNNMGHIHAHWYNYLETQEMLTGLQEILQAVRSPSPFLDTTNDATTGSREDFLFFYKNLLVYEEQEFAAAPAA